MVNKHKKTYSTSLINRKIPIREFGINIYILQYFKWITNRTYCMDSVQCHVAAWMGEEFVGEWIHVYV